MKVSGVHLAILGGIGSVVLFSLEPDVPRWIGFATFTFSLLLLLYQPIVRTIALRFVVPTAVGLIFFFAYDSIHKLPEMEVVRSAFAAEGSQLDLMVEIFSGMVSNIYALLVAFLVFKSMQDHDSINITLRDEALRLESMSQILPYLHDDGGQTNSQRVLYIHGLLMRYADNVLSERFRVSGHMLENMNIVNELSERLGQLKILDENDRVAFDQLISRMDDLMALRSHRISYMMSKPSPFMVLMLVVLSLFVIGPLYLPVVNGEVVSPFFVACMGFALSFLFLMMVDMSSHFSGYWQVDRKPFRESRNQILARIERLKVEISKEI